MITFGSVCSGIDAASVAWNPLGWKGVWASEIEPFPCALLAYHYPDMPNLGNMLDIPRLLRNGTLFAPDVFTGGTPCQAFSIAGLRNSLNDARGNLSMTFCEIADEIDIQRAANGLPPCVIKWENVPGVLTTKDNAFGCFLAGLAGEDEALVPEPCPAAGKSGRYWKWDKKTGQHALGWPKSGVVIGPQRAVAWRILDAQYFGVAQRRKRVFVVASARAGFDPAAVLFEFDGVRRDTAPRRQTGQDAPAGTLRSTDGGSDVDHARGGHLQPVAYGGNNQSGPIDVATARNACSSGSGRLDFESETFLVQPVAATLDASYGRLQGCSGQDMTHNHSHLIPTSYAIQAGALRTNPASGPDGVGVQEYIAYTLEARAEVQAVAFSCKDYGADASVELAPAMRAMGHQGSHANAGGQLAVCITGDVTHTLKAEGFDASEDGTGRGQPIVASFAFAQNSRDEVRLVGGDGEVSGALAAQPGMKQTTYVAPGGMAVRRLTPRECERLQGFPDDYTLIPFGRAVRMEKLEQDWIKYLLRGGVMTFDQVCRAAADGPRYKALGNSWAIPVVRRIGARIHAAIAEPANEPCAVGVAHA
jgi:DNA (cytosine-5)-methyltransferase 1